MGSKEWPRVNSGEDPGDVEGDPGRFAVTGAGGEDSEEGN